MLQPRNAKHLAPFVTNVRQQSAFGAAEDYDVLSKSLTFPPVVDLRKPQAPGPTSCGADGSALLAPLSGKAEKRLARLAGTTVEGLWCMFDRVNLFAECVCFLGTPSNSAWSPTTLHVFRVDTHAEYGNSKYAAAHLIAAAFDAEGRWNLPP
jgi:hypothetical protein